ncbi:MAG: CPBP family intramembrane metalloprotease, partial [Treponema sp.]|nr:CPBP family intramembrane metalloprotease [Treponema sp.]
MEGKVYPTIKNSILLCLLFLGIMCGFIILPLIYLELLGIFNISFILTNLTTYTTIITFEIVVVIGFIKAARTFNEVFKFNKVSLFLWIAIIVFMVGFCIIISELENFLEYILPRPDWIRKQSESLRVMVKENFIWAIILIAIISPCIEEMFFRGLILGGLNNNYSKRTAIIMSALLFGATCLTSLNPWQILIVFITGLFAAWICINTNSILLCIYMRFFFNVLSIVTIKFGNLIPIKGFQSYNGAPVEFQRLWFDLIGLAIFIVGIILLKKGFEKTKTITQNIKQNSDSTAVRFSIKAKLILIIFSIVIVTLFLFSFILPVTSKIKTDKEKSSRENRQMYMNRIFVDEVHMDISYMIRSMQELIMTTVLNADTLFIEETKDRFFERNSQITAVFFEYPALINHPLSGEQLLINKQFFESQEIELNLVDSYFENSRSVQKRVLRGESVLLNAAPHFGIPVLACLFPMQSGVGGILFSSERITENFNKRYGAPVTIFFINGDGDILLHDDFTLVKLGINLSRDDYIRSVLDGSADAFHTDKYDFGLLQPSDNQYLVTRVYSGIAKTVMFISTDNDMSNKLIEKDAEKINQITLVFFCIFYIAAIIFVMFFSRTISNPLKVLAVAAHNIGEGNFKIPLEEKKRNDETGLLFENFQNMCKALNVFGKFTNEEIAVKAMRDEIKPGDSLNQYATILFSDIRSFTTISEGMAPDDLVNSLNRYFSGQVDIIYNRRGVVDKYIGDAIMAFWGAPEKHDDDALQSVLA